MELQTLFILLLQVLVADSFRQVTGYLGETVTLPSGADPSWNISRIEWSILSNNTWIATYRHKKKSIERFWRYNGRLSLNTSSGDLTINNLSREDALEYTVDLGNTTRAVSQEKIKLIVRQHLQKPNIHERFSVLTGGSCVMALQCSSPDEGVHFSLQVHPSHVILPAPSSILHFKHPDNNTSTFLTIFSPNSEVNFTCTATNSIGENASSLLTSRCYDTFRDTGTDAERFGYVFLGIVLTLLVGAPSYFFRAKIADAWKCLVNKFHKLT